MAAVVEALKKVVEGQDLSRQEMVSVMEEIMDGEATHAQIGALLTALRMKGETVEEIAGAAEVMRSKATRVEPRLEETDPLLDIVGTGGDQSGTFNVSTTTAFVVAGAGVKVAKHGNRSVSSKSGAADLLEALGVNLAVDQSVVARCIEEVGLGFLFAPNLHPAMKNVVAPRQQMGIRTIFNLLGPLTNPAGAPYELMGVFTADLVMPLAKVLGRLGAKAAWVVHGSSDQGNGMDELSISGATKVASLSGGKVEEFEVTPEDFGLERAPVSSILGGGPIENAEITKAILAGERGPRRDMVVLNAAAALMVAGRAEDPKAAAEMAQDSIDSGKAKAVLDGLVEITNTGNSGETA